MILDPEHPNDNAVYEEWLEAQLEMRKRQVARLQDAFKIACMIADDRRNPHQLTQYAPNMMGEDSLSEMGLEPGDLDPITF